MNSNFKKILSGLMVVALVVSGFQPSALAYLVPTNEVIPGSDNSLGVLTNPGFEQAIGSGFGNWDSTNGAVRVVAPPAGFSAFPEGASALSFLAGQFTFQVYDGVHAGDFVSFSALAESSFAPLPAKASDLKIDFKKRNSDGSDTLISSVLSTPIDNTTAPNGGGYKLFTASGTLPTGADRVVVVFETNFAAGAGRSVIDSAVLEVNPTALRVVLAKRTAKVGDVVPALVSFTNHSPQAYHNVQLHFQLPQGLNVNLSEVRKNNVNAQAIEGSVIVPLEIDAGQSFNIAFPIVVTSGVTPGHSYDLDFTMTGPDGMNEYARERLSIVNDPMFDESTLIGKVFHDRNRNGVQDPGDEGMPFVNLYTEEGIMVTTDSNGMYHIPNIKPGRHVIKIDAHTLPEKTEFVTEESYLFKSTPGVMNKVNFAVAPHAKEDWEGGSPGMPAQFAGDLHVQITQGLDTAPPRLDVMMQPDVLKLGAGILERSPLFTFDMNYPHVCNKWILEIRDEMGRKVWSGYGIGKPPPDVMWEGLTDAGILIKPGIYSYQFKIEDDKGRQDWSLLKFFRVFSKAGKKVSGEDWEGTPKEETVYQANPKADPNYREEISPVGNFNIFQDGKRSIPLVAKPTVRVRGQTKPGFKAYINGAPVEVDNETGRFEKDFIVKPGDNEFVINAVSPDGESTVYTEKVKVKDSTFFLVGLGEEQLGKNFGNGSIATSGGDKQYKDGFYQDGRLAFFLKGKLKGKFLVKAKYDSGDNRSALFTNLDPDQYYPIYGDKSQINYEGLNTDNHLYLLVEMDRSFLRWGSFETKFDDTELATYNRTLSGLQIHHESLQTTAYGDPKRGVKAFWSDSKNRAAHIELESTGGSLYYLRDRNIVQGSEQLSVEVRDKIQDMAIGRYDLHEGTDYSIDYESGRVLLNKPLSSLAASSTLFSTDLADGSRIFLIADYEYVDAFDSYKNGDRGARGYVHLGDHIRVGGTMVQERRQQQDYDLRGADMTIKLGRNTRIVSEYATTERPLMDQSVSFDGGLSYAGLSTLPTNKDDPRNRAYSIKAETKPIKNWETSGYVQSVGPDFDSDELRSQAGFKKYGLASQFKLSDSFRLKYRYDHNELSSRLSPAETNSILAPFDGMNAHIGGVTYDDGLWLAEAEYLHRKFNGPSDASLQQTLESEVPFNDGVVGKLGYRVNDKLLPYVKAQTTINGKGDHQFGGGLRYEVANDLYAYIEQMFGKIGDSTLFGIEKRHGDGASTYANLKSLDRGIGYKTLTTAIGSNYFFDNGSRLYSEREHSTYQAQDGYADIFGYDGKINDHWDYGARYERRHLQNSTTPSLDILASDALARSTTYNTLGGQIAYIGTAQQKSDWVKNAHYSPQERLKARASGEFRRDQDEPSLWQVVTRDSIEYKVSRDLNFLSYLNTSISHISHHVFSTDFMEWNTGFAYRPVNYDRFNALIRYTYIENNLEYLRVDGKLDDRAHVFQTDFSYQICKSLELVEKVGFKRSMAAYDSDGVFVNSLLWANRLNYHITRKWDIASEYRILFQGNGGNTLRHGALFEVDRELYEYVRLGMGYDFAKFTDDLRKSNDYRSHGPFVRMTGKF